MSKHNVFTHNHVYHEVLEAVESARMAHEMQHNNNGDMEENHQVNDGGGNDNHPMDEEPLYEDDLEEMSADSDWDPYEMEIN